MKNLIQNSSSMQNQQRTSGESRTRTRIKSIFIKRILKSSNPKKTYTYGVINLRKGTITRAVAEY